MEIYYNDYQNQVDTWPSPVTLTHPDGVVYLLLTFKKTYIHAKWFGHVTADNVITGAKLYLELIQKKPHTKLLNDKTSVTGDWEEANDWLEYEWLPHAKEFGLNCLAHVYSKDMFSRLSARNLYLRITPNLNIENFIGRKEAENWLSTCPPEGIEDSNNYQPPLF
jgi:hypothetical protein